MLYKTRGNAHPQGKPRVYFTGHPKDIALYFDKIADGILEKQNCAIFYDEDPNKIEDEQTYFSDLSQMQLIVIAVTRNFLYHENIAFSKVFKFAMEKHIPVLPIMEESGLESEFNRLCTDTNSLKSCFPQIPDCTNPNDETALAEALLSSLEHIAKSGNDNDPQHNFFIGLVHLNGIDVEVDHERALKIITSFRKCIILGKV